MCIKGIRAANCAIYLINNMVLTFYYYSMTINISCLTSSPTIIMCNFNRHELRFSSIY